MDRFDAAGELFHRGRHRLSILWLEGAEDSA
jgi:hypothetical protein